MPSRLQPSKWGRWVWALLSLALILLFDLLFIPGFFGVTQRDGQLFGSAIDILNRGAPVMLLALGMTLVIATGGIDLSVGATMAIVGAIAAIAVTKWHMPTPEILL